MVENNRINTYLYNRKFDLTLLDGVRVNLPMYRNHTKIYKGVNNNIKFTLRDADRKPVKLIHKTLFVNILDQESNQVILTKSATILDDRKGWYSLNLVPGDIDMWPIGYYSFSVILRDEDLNDVVLFTDLDQNAIGTFYLDSRSVGEFQPAIEILPDDFMLHYTGGAPAPENAYYVTGRYPGDAFYGQQDGLHTIALYTTDFIGQFIIQGSLEDTPTADNEFFDISVLDLDEVSGITPINFEGNFIWIRFKYIKDEDNAGTIDKVWYRN